MTDLHRPLMNDGEHVAVAVDGPTGASLSWEGIKFEVKGKQILKGINGTVRAGQLCAIMGPSGAGKSTLLNVLSGRMAGVGRVSGHILVDGMEVDPTYFRTQIAYVMQEDALFATQTPREALEFSAALRLPSTLSSRDRKELVEGMLDELGLRKCADTYIGSIMIKGISGGEKKRTAIGVELISAPHILFLDEPTSGLDSFAAYNVVQILQRLARNDTTIICTIHQPSSEVFDLFDETLLLADGQLIYHDSVSDLVPYFAGHGHTCKPNYNPADFIMFLMQKSNKDELLALSEAWAKTGQAQKESRQAQNREEKRQKRILSDQAANDAEATDPNQRMMRRRTSSIRQIESIQTKAAQKGGRRANICTQLGYLGMREARNVARDKGALIARFGITIFLNTIIGLVFKDAGRWEEGTEMTPQAVGLWLQNHFGALTQVAIGSMFGLAQPTLLGFPLERPVFLREHATGTYAAWPYFVSKLVAEIPMAILQSAVIWLVTYWLIGFQGNIIYLILATALLGLTSASTALLIGSTVANVQVAIQLTPLLFVPQLLFSGFFISISKIPSFLRWAQYACSLKYGINLIMVAEFQDLPPNFPEANATVYYETVLGCPNPDLSTHSCATIYNDQALYPRSDVSVPSEWLYFGVLVGVFALFRIVALITLSCKARR